MDKILNGQAQQKFLTSQFLLTIQYIINQRNKIRKNKHTKRTKSVEYKAINWIN